jgi:hypothetical protein
MNKLPSEESAHAPHLLCERAPIRVTTRLTRASKNMNSKLLDDAGATLDAYRDMVICNLNSEKVPANEIWPFTYAKERNVTKAKAAPEHADDTWSAMAVSVTDCLRGMADLVAVAEAAEVAPKACGPYEALAKGVV